MAGEPRYTTTLVGMDGKPRTTTPRGKVAEAEFLARVKQIVSRVPRAEQDAREVVFLAYKQRLRVGRELAQAQEAERDAIDRQQRRADKEAAQANKEALSGEVYLRVYEDLGEVWTRRWLKDEIAPDVPDIVHCELSSALTCKALRRGVEALKERRRRNQAVRDPAVFVVDVATRWQRSKPTLRVPLAEALLMPEERIAPSR